jgi:hypothetical protein
MGNNCIENRVQPFDGPYDRFSEFGSAKIAISQLAGLIHGARPPGPVHHKRISPSRCHMTADQFWEEANVILRIFVFEVLSELALLTAMEQGWVESHTPSPTLPVTMCMVKCPWPAGSG